MRSPRAFSLLSIASIALLLAGCAVSPAPVQSVAPQTREYHLFTSTIDFNETLLGVPHDSFTPDLIVGHKGDTIVIHYHNLEDTDEHHTFTMDAPYAVNDDVAPNEEANITIVADTAGVFTYICTYHQPTMTGHVLIIG